MKRLIPLLLAIGTLVLAMTPVQARAQTFAQSAYSENHLFVTPDQTDVIYVVRYATTSLYAANLMVSEQGVERWIAQFNQTTPGSFTTYSRVQDSYHPVHNADRVIAYRGITYVGGRANASRLTVTRAGLDVFFFFGVNPEATYYRYLDECNLMDAIRPAPYGFYEWVG